MKIDGVNFNGFKVTNSTKNNRGQNKSNTSFKGHILTQDNKGDYVYKFFLPNTPQNSKLHLAVMTKDKNGEYKIVQKINASDMPEGHRPVSIKAKNYLFDEDSRLGYRFSINGADYTDESVKNADGYNIAVSLKSANPHRSRLMQHVLIDSFNVPNPTAAKRNHFNLLGGTLKSVEAKVPVLAEYGIGEIIGNPIFGQGNKENHGYWTVNPYQITKNIGSYKDFKNLMITLFNNGMGWTADGAFVNEGMEGARIQDIANWGVRSPFVNMFETKDIENTPVRFGVFSKNREVNKHIHIKLVNAPYKITYEQTADGYKEKEVKKTSFDPTQSTYIQVFDDRLVSTEQANDNKIFDVYANKETQDRYEIACTRDSVQPLHFRVKPTEVQINFEKFKENKKFNKDAKFKDFLTQWTNFSLVNANKDGGISLWVGNNDISKKRFVLTENALHEMKLSPEKEKEVRSAQYQVQDDTVQVGGFWTNENARILTEYTAKALGNTVAELAAADSGKSKAQLYEDAVKLLIKRHVLPESAQKVYEKDKKYEPSALENLLTISEYTGQRKYKLKPVVMPQNIMDGVMSYPLEAIEFATDLTSVLAYPFIKNLGVDEDTVGLSRYEMFQKGDDYYNLIPQRYRELYKKTDKLYEETVTPTALKIMKQLEQKAEGNWFEGDELTTEGREIYSVLAPDVAKFIFVSALAPDVDFDKNSDTLDYNLDKLRTVGLNKLNLQYEVSPEDVVITLQNKIKKGIESIPSQKIDDFTNHLANRLKGINSDSVNVAKLIIDKTETGMDWRIDAAKDVGDWDAVDANRFDEPTNASGIMAFWSKFNKNVNKYNPNSYKIGEITDWGINKATFIDKSKFDTITDYECFFSDLVSLYSQNNEGNFAGDFYNKFNNSLDNYFKSGTLDNINYAHRFVGNHDKPRILHMLATNVSAFNMDKAKEVERVLAKGFDGSKEFNSLDDECKDAIKKGLNLLRSGFHTVNGVKKEFDSENFAVRPFEYSIDDAVKEACVANKKFKTFAEKNPDKIEKIKAEALEAVLKPALSKYRSILLAMVALPGTPTHYSGDEFGQTGWETPCKNEKQENRNAVRWDLLENPNYGFIQDYYNKVFKPLMKVRSKEAASALVNGTTLKLNEQIGLNDTSPEDSRGGVYAFYRYNDKTDAIAVLHGVGFGGEPEQAGKNSYIDSINLVSIKGGLPKGTIYLDALNTKERFKVTDDGYHIVRIDQNGNKSGSINLGNAGLILLRESDFKGNKLSFKGRIGNPNVKLANTKYNFNYMSR